MPQPVCVTDLPSLEACMGKGGCKTGGSMSSSVALQYSIGMSSACCPWLLHQCDMCFVRSSPIWGEDLAPDLGSASSEREVTRCD
jgi:hypothetical protein